MAFYNYNLLSSDLTQNPTSVWNLSLARLQYLLTWKKPKTYSGLAVNGGNGSHVYNFSQLERDKVRINDTGTTGVDKLVFTPNTQGLTAAQIAQKRYDLIMAIDDIGLEEIVLSKGSYAGINFNGSALKNGVKISAGNLTDSITGTAYADTIYGGGQSVLKGGKGDDAYILGGVNDVITENANEGLDTVQSGFDYTLGANLERLTLTGTDNLKGTGNGLDNTLTGNSGNNTLDGAAGADTMTGGAGDDTYYVDNANDKVVELSGEGNDTVIVDVSVNYQLSDNVENCTLIGSTPGVTGNSLNNILKDETVDGDSTLDGGAGVDRIIGGSGVDRLTGGTGADVFEFADGDALIGSGFNNFETITDFEAGVDLIDVPGQNVRTVNVAWTQKKSRESDFSAEHFDNQFYRYEGLEPGGACAVVMNTGSSPRTFLVIDSNNNGFDLDDNVIEITGYRGSLSNITVI